MGEWEYVRLMNKNYLQIVSCQEFETLFQYRMLVANPIKGLLPCTARNINGLSYLMYDISSLQSLSSMYSNKKMHFEQFLSLMMALKAAIKSLEEYLLDASNLMLTPEFIFQEPDTKQLYFLYYPYLNENDKDTKRVFCDFLIEIIDHEDEELVELVYLLYEQMQEAAEMNEFQIIYEKAISLQEGRLRKKEEPDEEQEQLYEKDNLIGQDTEEWCIEQEERMLLQSNVDIKKIGGLYLAFAFLLGGGLFYIYRNYTLSASMHRFLLTSAVVLILGVGVGTYVYYRRCKNQKDEPIVNLHKEPENIYFKQDEEKREWLQHEFDGIREIDYGRTMYFEAKEIENKLYSCGKERIQAISIDKFPFVIGKRKEDVDAVLEDDSVSRIHARFIKREERIYLEDLNSTNGTYKNGILLQLHEISEVLPDDQIRFGKLQFIYK